MNCSAQLYSTRSTVSVHCEKNRRWVPEKNDIVADVCKRCVVGGVRVFKWDEKRAQVMRERNGGGCDRLRPFSIIAIWAVVVLTKYRRSTVTSAQVSCCIGIMHWC